jgi:hypothetical protein
MSTGKKGRTSEHQSVFGVEQKVPFEVIQLLLAVWFESVKSVGTDGGTLLYLQTKLKAIACLSGVFLSL